MNEPVIIYHASDLRARKRATRNCAEARATNPRNDKRQLCHVSPHSTYLYGVESRPCLFNSGSWISVPLDQINFIT